MADQSREVRERQAMEEASMWLERLERTLQQSEGARLREWLGVPLHRKAIVERCMLWHGPEVLAVLGKLIPVDLAPQRAQPFSGRRSSAVAAALAIGCVAVATIILALWTRTLHSDSDDILVDEVYRTAIGARRDVKLPDGSLITLNTATRLVVNYGVHSRDVFLLEGEAAFDVAADPARPFRLSAGQRRFETGASRFNLHRLSTEDAELIVAEGEITILRPNRHTDRTPAQLRNPLSYSYGEAALQAMQGAVIGTDWQSVWKLGHGELQSRLAWQQGLIVFADEPLEDALAQVKRYTDKEFVFADKTLRSIRVHAQLRTGDVDGVRRVLRDDYSIASRLDASGRIVLARD